MNDRYEETRILADLLPELLDKSLGMNSAAGLRAVRVVNVWKDVLGATMGRYSSREKFENGVLVVKIQSAALRHELFMNRKSVIDKVNQKYGSEVVKQLILN